MRFFSVTIVLVSLFMVLFLLNVNKVNVYL